MKIRAFLDRSPERAGWVVQDDAGREWRASRVDIQVPAELVMVGSSAGHLIAYPGSVDVVKDADPPTIMLSP